MHNMLSECTVYVAVRVYIYIIFMSVQWYYRIEEGYG